MRDIPATKITGLNTIAKRLETLKSFPNHQSHTLSLNNCMRIRNGAPIIKIHKSPILIMFAMTSNKSPIVKKNNNINFNKNSRVIVGTAFPASIAVYS
jgi:hypothetical protein